MKKLILILFILTVSLSFAQAQLTVNPFLGTCNPVCSFVAEKNPYFRINNPETTIKYGIELHKQNQRLAYKSGIYYQNSGSSIYTEIPEYLRNTDLKYSQSNIIAATTYAFLAGSDILLKSFNISHMLHTRVDYILNSLNGTFLLQSKGTVYGFMVYFPIRLTQRKPIYQTPPPTNQNCRSIDDYRILWTFCCYLCPHR